jgi:group I intron endonuclease
MKEGDYISYKVYCITNIITNKKYIGITSRNIKTRFREHCRSNKLLTHEAIIEYGEENFTIEILEDNIQESEIDEKERYYINKYNTLFPFGYNKSTGGIHGKDLNVISKKLLSIKGSGINNSRCNKYIQQYDLNGNLLNKFGSTREAARYLGDESKYRGI